MNGLEPFEKTIEQTTKTITHSSKTRTAATRTKNRITSLRELLHYLSLLCSLWRQYLQSLYYRELFKSLKKEESTSDLLVMAFPEREAFDLSLTSSSFPHLLPQSQWHHCHCHFHPFHCCFSPLQFMQLFSSGTRSFVSSVTSSYNSIQGYSSGNLYFASLLSFVFSSAFFFL